MKSEFIQIRVSAEEKKLIKSAASEAGMDISAYLLSKAGLDLRAKCDGLAGEL